MMRFHFSMGESIFPTFTWQGNRGKKKQNHNPWAHEHTISNTLSFHWIPDCMHKNISQCTESVAKQADLRTVRNAPQSLSLFTCSLEPSQTGEISKESSGVCLNQWRTELNIYKWAKMWTMWSCENYFNKRLNVPRSLQLYLSQLLFNKQMVHNSWHNVVLLFLIYTIEPYTLHILSKCYIFPDIFWFLLIEGFFF